MLFRGAWAIEKGGSPCSFGRYGAQRHHFEAAHSIRLAPTDFHTESALSRLMRSAHSWAFRLLLRIFISNMLVHEVRAFVLSAVAGLSLEHGSGATT